MNVQTAVCFNQSLSPPLQSQGANSQSSEPLRETRGRRQVQRDEKRKDTEIEQDVYGVLKIFFFPGLKNLAESNAEADQVKKKKMQPLLIESAVILCD